MTRKMRLGLIGAGGIAQTYVQALASSDAAQLVGVADVRAEAAQALAERGGVQPYKSFRDLLAGAECEGAIVCTPPSTHPDICCELLDRGVHVLCEKPLAIGPAEARSMVDAAERSPALLTMASKFRYARDVVEAKSIVASGLIGDVILLKMRSLLELR